LLHTNQTRKKFLQGQNRHKRKTTGIFDIITRGVIAFLCTYWWMFLSRNFAHNSRTARGNIAYSEAVTQEWVLKGCARGGSDSIKVIERIKIWSAGDEFSRDMLHFTIV
jgi:hypothetical protein